MRVVLIITALLLVAVSAAAVAPDAEPFRQYLPQVTLALAILVLIGVFWQPRQKTPPRTRSAEPTRPAPNGLKRAVQQLKSSSSWRCSRKKVGWSIS